MRTLIGSILIVGLTFGIQGCVFKSDHEALLADKATVDQELWLLILPPTRTLFVCWGKYSSLRTGSYRAVRRVAYATRVVLDSPPPRDGLGISREDLSLRSFVP